MKLADRDMEILLLSVISGGSMLLGLATMFHISQLLFYENPFAIVGITLTAVAGLFLVFLTWCLSDCP